MFTEDKVTEIFYLADEFCKFFDEDQEKSMLSAPNNVKKHCCKLNRMSDADKICLRKRALIETVNDELKNIAQVEHSRHRCFDNFIVNMLGTITAYCMFPKKPCINVQRTLNTQLTLF